MSDLSATNCGCGCDSDDRFDRDCRCNNWGNGWGNNSCLWIILLLFCSGGCGNGWGREGGCNDNCLWIILLLLFCCGGCNHGC
ncbi:chorion class high-cysteine HCB protein 13 [Faecalicatena contorta]|uniref:chorion class high-cysteine HCB protein 13 n=1 Tax=Faecalicatena contorta TaxID=39482 RepID=UPI001F25CBB9|nr:chorion class high-cysteine HCB protein 13 [Faecalicatena contorta]MCF2682907.1 chorion class high-cysteine HCB protein 13 [Faecalicatena contorta]